MKPTEPIDRESLLDEIRRSLDRMHSVQPKSTDSAAVSDTLGSVVFELIQHFANLAQDPPDIDAMRRELVAPLSLLDLAAYVDGTLKNEVICKEIAAAAISDPDVMMELVSGVLSRQQAPARIADPLRARLLAMRPITQEPPLAMIDNVLSHDFVSHSQPSVNTAVIVATKEMVDSQVNLTPGKSLPYRRSKWRVFAALACAAAILVVVGLSIRSRRSELDGSPAVVEQPSVYPDNALVDAKPSSTEPTESFPQQRQTIEDERGPSVVQDNREPSPRLPKESALTDSFSMDDEQALPIVAPDMDVARRDADSMAASSVPVQPLPNQAPPKPFEAKWSEIHGLLVAQEQAIDQSDDSSGSPRSRGIKVDDTTTLASETAESRIRYRTLPLSRAGATLDGGAKLVMSGDTSMEFHSDGSIHLNHGEFLLSSKESPIDFQLTVGMQTVRCRAERNASVVVRRNLDGLEMDMVGAPVSVDGKAFEDARVAIEDRRMAATKVAEAPERLPKWTTSNVDRIEIGRNVLAQFSASDNVQQTVLQSLASGAVRGDSATVLRNWVVAMSDDDLFWLIQSEDPRIRETAFRYLSHVGPSDPRHGRLWHNLRSRYANPRAFHMIRTFFIDIWEGKRPDRLRRESLLAMFQAPDSAERATANYLLQTFYGPGPGFDLNLSPIAQARAIGIWRTRMSRYD